MKSPTVPRLVAAFRDLAPKDARKIKRLCQLVDHPEELRAYIAKHCPFTDAYARRCYHDPFDSGMWRRTMVLDAIDRILDTHGVEPLGSPHDSMFDGPAYEYCNAGDPYITTLIYDRDNDRLFIGDWGSIVETDPRFQDQE